MSEETIITFDGKDYKESELNNEQRKIAAVLRAIGQKRKNLELTLQSVTIDIESMELSAQKYIKLMKESLDKKQETN
tara:strand:- start:331 stop:561 length:231 start_codon:yes stop_codon:yes gene_type:complete